MAVAVLTGQSASRAGPPGAVDQPFRREPASPGPDQPERGRMSRRSSGGNPPFAALPTCHPTESARADYGHSRSRAALTRRSTPGSAGTHFLARIPAGSGGLDGSSPGTGTPGSRGAGRSPAGCCPAACGCRGLGCGVGLVIVNDAPFGLVSGMRMTAGWIRLEGAPGTVWGTELDTRGRRRRRRRRRWRWRWRCGACGRGVGGVGAGLAGGVSHVGVGEGAGVSEGEGAGGWSGYRGGEGEAAFAHFAAGADADVDAGPGQGVPEHFGGGSRSHRGR